MKDIAGFWNGSSTLQDSHLEEWSYNILNDLKIVPTTKCQGILNGHRMKFKETASGFSVWAHVELEQLGSITKYKPLIPVNSDIEFTFRFKVRNPLFNNIANLRLRPNVEANFYFSNQNPAGQSQYPSLALNPPLHDNGRAYEMGEKVVDVSGNIFVAQLRIDGLNALNTVNGWESGTAFRYFSYQDQLLVPKKFRYYFTPGPTSAVVVDPSFLLRAMDNSPLDGKIITGNFPNNSYCNLDYSDFETGFYRLEITATGYKEIKTIYLNGDLYDPYDWGMINIVHKDNLNDFRMLEPGGYLRLNNNLTEPPVFDVRIDSRSTYWKYILHPLDTAGLGNINPGQFEIVTPDTFISRSPLHLNRFQVSQTAGIQNKLLPLPYNGMIQPVNGKIYSEIFLPKMNL